MFMHPYIRRELSRERQRDMLTHAQTAAHHPAAARREAAVRRIRNNPAP